MAQGEFAGGRAGGQAAGGPVAEQDDPGAQGLGLVDPVAEEVVGVGARGERPGEQGAVGGQRLGQLGGERGAAGELGEDGGEPAPDGAGGGALRPDRGRLSASSAARVLAGLLYVAMAGPQRSAVRSRRSATFCSVVGGRVDQADPVERARAAG